jgi:CubicO group peptidase (beta-lactamase class C family)
MIASTFAIAAPQPAGADVTSSGAKNCPDATDSFRTARPESVGLDPEKIRAAVDLLSVNGSETVKVFRYNCLVDSGIFDPVAGEIPGHLWSGTKLITSLAVGRAVTLGKLQVDAPIGKYLAPGLGDAAHRAITVEELLTHTSGVHMNYPREFNLAAPNTVREFMSDPFDHEPGTYFKYEQTGLTVLDRVVEIAVGEDFQSFVQRELFEKVGIPRDHWFWGTDRSGHSIGAGFLFLPGNDFARFGQLLLNDGTFAGQRVITAEFLRAARTSIPQNPAMGYLLWLNRGPYWINPSMTSEQRIPGRMYGSAPADMYTAAFGAFGQNIWVIPSLSIVVTRSSGTLTTASSRTDISDPEGPGLGTPGQVEYEFFRILMQSVQDTPRAAAPAYTTPAVGAFDAGLFVNPDDNLDLVGAGSTAPPGCSTLGCGGQIPGAEAVPALMAGGPAYASAGARLPGGFQVLASRIPDLFPRLLDGWSQTTALTTQQAPRTVPSLVETSRQSADASQNTTAHNLARGNPSTRHTVGIGSLTTPCTGCRSRR